MQPVSNTDTATVWKNPRFLSRRKYFHMVTNLSKSVHVISYRSIDIALERWDIATEVNEVVY